MSVTPTRPLALIAAVGRGGVIGSSSGRFGLPWHLPEDLRRFRELTTGHAIVMGRTTYELIGRPLPKRRNLVLSRRPGLVIEGCEVFAGLDAALAAVADDPLPFVIGGAEVYAAALPRVTRIFLTEVDREVEGDVRFPPLPKGELREVSRVPGETEGLTFVEYERVGDCDEHVSG